MGEETLILMISIAFVGGNALALFLLYLIGWAIKEGFRNF